MKPHQRRSRARQSRPESPQTIGFLGERIVVRFLERGGYHILAQNWRSGRGELDIVAHRAHELVFIEVKTRREEVSINYAPLDGVTAEKQRRIVRLSHRFIRAHGKEIRKLRLRHIRYDIIGIIYRGRLTPPRILHYRSAFEPDNEISFTNTLGNIASTPRGSMR